MNYQNQYNQQNQQMFGGNTDGTPITLLRNDINSQNEHQANDNQSHYTVGSIETTSDIRNLVKEINSNIESKKQNKDELDTQDIIRLLVFGYSIYYYYTPVKTIFFDFLLNRNLLETIISMYKLFFSIDSTAKFIFYFIIYVLL
jgi:hypothetical protein